MLTAKSISCAKMGPSAVVVTFTSACAMSRVIETISDSFNSFNEVVRFVA